MFIAFTIDQIQEHCGYYFNKLKIVLKARCYVWEDTRSVFFFKEFMNWTELYEFMLSTYQKADIKELNSS